MDNTAYTVDWLIKLDPDSFIEELGSVPKIGVLKEEIDRMTLDMLTEEILEVLDSEQEDKLDELLKDKEIEKIKEFLFPIVPDLENKYLVCYFAAKKMLLLSELRLMEVMKMVGHEADEVEKCREIIKQIDEIAK